MPQRPVHYYVWRRSDGYVSATTYPPGKYGTGRLTFEILAEGDDWDEMHDVILAERSAVDATR
jgi:hypothetical protein